MNYLAHLALSGNDEEIMAGNFIGDSLRGIDISVFSPKIQKGIHLHRFIDNFTDHHPEFIKAKKVFSASFDKYSGALVDIFFDHFLASDFKYYFKQDLQQFAVQCYNSLEKYYHLLPERAQMFYRFMIDNNILFNYSKPETIREVLSGMTHRIQEKALLFNAIPIFLKHYDELRENFRIFFPELMSACHQFLIEKTHR